jgi:hypothetical protein
MRRNEFMRPGICFIISLSCETSILYRLMGRLQRHSSWNLLADEITILELHQYIFFTVSKCVQFMRYRIE